MPNEQPMSLEDLPEYLKSIKKNGDTGSSNLVGVGQITTNRSWFKITASIMSICVILVAAIVAYDFTSTENFTVIVEMNEGADPLPDIISDSGGQIISVKQNEDAIYEIKLDTKKGKRSFLDKLKKNKHIKKVVED